VSSIELYGDGIGRVELVDHMGTDLTIVNSARVSFGRNKEEIDERDVKLINYLVRNKHTSTFEHNLVTYRFTVPLFVRVSIIAIALGLITRSPDVTLMLLFGSMSPASSEPSTSQTDRRATPKN